MVSTEDGVLRITVEAASNTPPYEQVRGQLADFIETGVLAEGTRLPPVRQLAGDLDLAAGTVARAYSELESAGLVQTRRGGGTVVAPRPELSTEEIQRRLAERARQYLRDTRRLGATDDEALTAVERAIHASP
jgi:DNA-binding transcriptional regulator YhcF (GntR family)